MKRIGILLLVFLVGVIGTLLLTKKEDSASTETQLIYNGLEQIAKLQVTEGYFTEVITYKDSKSYFNDLVSFDKKALVVVNAKAQIAYDLKKLEIKIDSLQREIHLKKIPEPEVTIVPDITYYDMQQSSFNEFTAKDYNQIKKNVLTQLKQSKVVSDLKKQAHERLFEELSQLMVLSAHFNWKVVDETRTIKFKD